MREVEGAEPRTDLPVGTVVFLRTDIEGSMEHVQALGPRYDELNAQHAAIVRSAITTNGGMVVRTEGDAFFAVFADAPTAAAAAVEMQRAMADHEWPSQHEFRIRTGLHAGTAHRAGDDYGGFEVNRAARIAALGSGGQIVISEPVRALLAADIDDDRQVRDLGKHRLKGVVEPVHLYQLDAPGLPTSFPPLRSGTDGADHLPKRLTTFIGRERELAELGPLLERARLLTLTGPGGTGKTTLALELARRHADDYVDGAWFVDLQSVRDPDDVETEIALAIGLADGHAGRAADRLLGYVEGRQLLIVVDNFEQVTDAAPVIQALLEASQGSSVITTSRIPLQLSAEQEYRVRPLGTNGDEDGSEAVRLFIERARRVRPDLRLGDGEIDVIGETCRMLDGLPLAIELCAARTSALPLQVIHDRLQASLPLPDAAPRDLPERQRTIEATVAWSFDLLDEPLQRLFVRLGVFTGSFDLEQAEEICGPADELGVDVLTGLVRLVEHSLIFRVDDAVGGIRFDMLEAMHAFAGAQLEASGEQQELARRHAESYVALGERHRGPAFGDEAVSPFGRLDPDGPDLLAATRWAIDAGDLDLASRALGSLWRFWLQDGRLSECRELVDQAMALPRADERSLARVALLDAAGAVIYWTEGYGAALLIYEEQLAVAEELGDESWRALALANVATARGFGGDLSDALEALALATQAFEALGDRRVELAAEYRLVMRFLVALQDPISGRGTMEEVVADYAEAPQIRLRKLGLAARAGLASQDGHLAAAAHDIAAVLRIGLAIREIPTALADLSTVPWPGIPVEHASEATTALVALETTIDRLGLSIPYGFDRDAKETFASVLEPSAYEEAARRGRSMSLEQLADHIDALGDALPAEGAPVEIVFFPANTG